MHLNLFTNAIKTAPSIEIIKKTYSSFTKTFGFFPMTIWFDPKPKIEMVEEYEKSIYDYFKCEIIRTNSLSDGYIQSIQRDGDDYLFQLEHDWSFQNINHTIREIIEVMKAKEIYHFRFSRHINKEFAWLRKWQSFVREKEYNGFKYCETDNLSNNPHIIDRKKYLSFLDKIKVAPGSSGIEENLTKKGLIGCQYGGIDYPPTIKHLQGRKRL